MPLGPSAGPVGHSTPRRCRRCLLPLRPLLRAAGVQVRHRLAPDNVPTRASPHAVLDVFVGQAAVWARRAASIPAAR
eukprot:11188639-Lingulodinium_polyedra.AAC.1